MDWSTRAGAGASKHRTFSTSRNWIIFRITVCNLVLSLDTEPSVLLHEDTTARATKVSDLFTPVSRTCS